jgi:hypothetical protein
MVLDNEVFVDIVIIAVRDLVSELAVSENVSIALPVDHQSHIPPVYEFKGGLTVNHV